MLVCSAFLATASAWAGESTPPASQIRSEESSIKHIALTSDGRVYLALGGELRERFEHYDEPFFGLRGVEQNDYLLHRLLFSADLHAGDYFRVFLQLGDHLETGKKGGHGPTDVDEFDVQQGFVDVTVPFDARSKLMLRAGRQEVTFGSGRLVSVRDGANIRRSFDGFRLSFTAGDATFDTILARSVNLRVGAFNDDPNQDEALWGLYSVLPLRALPDGHADLYYLGLERDGAVFQQGVANEHRHSFGARFWGNPGAWDYNYEAVVQTGSFGDDDILAWTIATDTGYTFKSLPWSPRLGFKANLASGDGNPNDGRLATFNALFPKQPYFSEASIIAPANIIDVHPSLSAELGANVTATVDWNWFWKQRAADAVYAPPGRPLVRAGQSDSRMIGHQANVELEWEFNAHASLTLYYSHFFAGSAVTEAGGHDVDFFGSWMAFSF